MKGKESQRNNVKFVTRWFFLLLLSSKRPVNVKFFKASLLQFTCSFYFLKKIFLVTIMIKTEPFIYSTTLDGSRSVIHGSRYLFLFYFCTVQLLVTFVSTASKSVIPGAGTELTFTMLSNHDTEKSLPIQV